MEVFHPTFCFAFGVSSRPLIDTKLVETGNANVAADVLGCAAKVPSFTPCTIIHSAQGPVHPVFYAPVRLIPTRLASCQFEESLRNAADPNGLHQRAKVQAMLVYYSSRMEAVSILIVRCDPGPRSTGCRPRGLKSGSTQAWREANDGVAEFMLQKIMGETLLSPRHRHLTLNLGEIYHETSSDPTKTCSITRW